MDKEYIEIGIAVREASVGLGLNGNQKQYLEGIFRRHCAAVREIGPIQTKGDEIRAMSDEELAEWLTAIELRILQRQPMLERPAMKADWLDWLQSPAERR